MRELTLGSENFHDWETDELQATFGSRTALLKAIIMNAFYEGAPDETRTLREFWYEAVKIPLINYEPEKAAAPNWNRKASQALSAVLSDMVLEGELEYKDLGIVDDTRAHTDADGPFDEVVVFVEDHASYNKISCVAESYRIWMIEGAGYEATALLEKLIDLFQENDIDHEEVEFLVLGMTDYDAFGYKIFEDLVRRMRQLGMTVEEHRVGIMPGDVPTSDLHKLKFPIPVKCDYDREWVRKHGIGGPYGLELQAVDGERRRDVLIAALEEYCPEKKLYDWLKEDSWKSLPFYTRLRVQEKFLGNIPAQMEQKVQELMDEERLTDTRGELGTGTVQRRAREGFGSFMMSLGSLPTRSLEFIMSNCVEKYEIVEGKLELTWKEGEAPDMSEEDEEDDEDENEEEDEDDDL